MTESEIVLIGIGEIGLEVGCAVDEPWQNHRQLADGVADEILRRQAGMAGKRYETQLLTALRVDAFEGDPGHKCLEHSAPARLVRTLEQTGRLELDPPLLCPIAEKVETRF